ncbi:hypothetical protein J2W49_001887 [Hydrogenophaga palleronii]|uniref:F5/8 type C domain-containing protein n=1 Tax=Hydrogenophaga palleronii TaxID=65655 RepID=A0ABU1WLL6_9BURK|nr:discoidin domain-containing protein [Hydrogenophaga palleronii]MDR7149932.1 hypothetical protein [Hydrogenophaga palleronii]
MISPNTFGDGEETNVQATVSGDASSNGGTEGATDSEEDGSDPVPSSPSTPEQVRAITHPGAPLTLSDLQTLKVYIDEGRQPWKSAYELLAKDGRAQATYGMAGPFAKVSRAPDENLWPWRVDMMAIWNLSRRWYFTQDDKYAIKAREVLLAWATNHTEFAGRESMLDLGDYAYMFVGGADILRGTWPGWSETDTAVVKKYFKEVLMPASNPYGEIQYGAANKGALYSVKRSTSPGGGYTTIASDIKGSSYTDRSVSNGTTYYYTVTATNSAGMSDSSPEDSATPVRPLAYIATGGAASDSANNPTNALSAFDQNSATQWFYTGVSGWLQYDLGRTEIVRRYTVTNSFDRVPRDPKGWQFQGSSDDVSWTTLDVRSNQMSDERFVLKSYGVASPAAYRYYRLNITANNGEDTFIAPGEFGLFAARP